MDKVSNLYNFKNFLKAIWYFLYTPHACMVLPKIIIIIIIKNLLLLFLLLVPWWCILIV
jgi:hypothetical protein